MMQPFREMQTYDLNKELEEVIFPHLLELLNRRKPGHCMRVTDIDTELMVRLCGRLRSESVNAEVVVLGGDANQSTPPEMTVSSTKLVELRNPFQDGTLRPPLLVFIPSHVRAAAEDSFGVATFEDVQLENVFERLLERLLEQLPSSIRGGVNEILNRLSLQPEPWLYSDELSKARFLVTAKINGNDPEAIGAALYEIGLVPDFELLTQPEKAPFRATRNRDCMRSLTWSAQSERGRVLELGLKRRDFMRDLGTFLAEAGLEDPRAWTRQIVLDRNYWCLSFDKWEFEDDNEAPDSIFIGDVHTSLPVVSEDETDETTSQLVGQTILPLGKNGLRKFNVTFRVSPLPSKVQGLERFAVQVISKEHGPIGFVRKKSVWKGNREQATVSFNKLTKTDWEEGWHFIRILPLTASNDLIPITDEAGEPIPWSVEEDEFVRRPNESDLFYVIPDSEVDVSPPQRAVQTEPSLVHAKTRLKFSALIDDRDWRDVEVKSKGWSEGRKRAAHSENIQLEFAREGMVNVPVSLPLKALEQKILSSPSGPLSWNLQISMETAGKTTAVPALWPEGQFTQQFIAARSAYFEALQDGDKNLITQAADFLELAPLVLDYAVSYQSLTRHLVTKLKEDVQKREALQELQSVLALDSVRLVVSDHRGQRREAALVGPTHPLRALWLTVWAALSESWLGAADKASSEYAVATRTALLKDLTSIGFPPVLPVVREKLFMPVDNLHPFWSLYAPPTEPDPRGLVGDICLALALPEPVFGGMQIDGAYLASKIRRYLIQHPYVHLLRLNVFNSGRATILAETLLSLQKEPTFRELRYDIRLFVPDPESPGTGEGLRDLLSYSSGTVSSEADAFRVPTESHLRPKLALAILPISEFVENSTNHEAHLTLLFDLFPAEEVGAAMPPASEWLAPVHGLVQDFEVEYRESEDRVSWSRIPCHGNALPLSGNNEFAVLLSSMSEAISSATAMVATGNLKSELRPQIKLTLDPAERALLHQVHEISDWVFTVDRNLGIEFFDHGGKEGRADYLIDHSPDGSTTSLGHRLTITSRAVAELESMLTPVLEMYGLSTQEGCAIALLDQLRALSGRLALKLLSSPTQRAEVLGLALSRMYLEYQGVFTNQIVVPLDAHLDLYHLARKSAEELGDEISFKRTDLALFDLNAGSRQITCRLVEVKCYNQVGDLGAYNALKDGIAEQIAQSEEILSYHFDPSRSTPDRPDRLIKTREFVSLLKFYLERSARYEAIDSAAYEEALFFLRTLEDGYTLAFTKSAIIFDFEKPGTGPAELEGGIEYHRVGSDLIRELVAASADSKAERSLEGADEMRVSSERSVEAVELRRERAPSIPSLEQAAFLSSERERSVSWDDLRASRESTGGAPPPPEASASDSLLDEDNEPEARPSANQKGSSDTIPAPEDSDSVQETPRIDPSKPYSEPLKPFEDGSEPAGEGKPDEVSYDVLIGVSGESPQFGVLGEIAGRKIAIDLNHTHTISLFGVQGGGKSYTLGTVAEMASLSIPNINQLPNPLASVIFHYSPTMDYKPEFTSMGLPNSEAEQLEALRRVYGAEPKALEDVLLLVPADKLVERRSEYPDLEVHPLKFAASELQASHWRFLMGAVGNQATYIRQLNQIMKRLRRNLTLDALRQGIDASPLSDHLKDLAQMRLNLAAEYIDDQARIGALVRPGRLVIVDLRDEFIEKDEALGLFVVLLQLFADAKHNGKAFNKLVVFDEAHKYIESPDLVAGLVEVVREMRHKGTSIMVASQDPPSVPVSLIELSSQIILHKFNSPAWLKHIQKANAALGGLTPEKMAHLRPGEAYLWSSKATDEAFCRGAIKIKCRPRVTQHGGATKTAVRD